MKDSDKDQLQCFNSMVSAVAIFDVKETKDGKEFFYHRVNDSFAALTGFAQDDVYGKNLLEIFPNAESDNSINWVKIFNKALDGEKFHQEVYSADTKMWLDVACYKIGDNQIGLNFYDITSKASYYKDLEHKESELRAIYDAAPVVMMLVNSDRRVQKINHTALSYIGKDIQDVLNKRGGEVFSCIHSFDNPLGCGYGENCSSCTIRNLVLDTLLAEQAFKSVEGRLHVKQGTNSQFIDVLISTSPLIINNEAHALVCIQDITEMKKTQNALRESLQKVEALSRFKSQLIANLNHEIRTPLNAILGFSEVIASMTKAQHLDHYSKIVTEATEQLTKVVDNLVIASDFEANLISSKK